MKKFSKTHEWYNSETNEVGISSNAVELLGDIVFLELPQLNQEVNQEESIAVVESVKAASDIYAPVSGKITEVNQELENSPEKLNEDPNVWMFKIENSDSEDQNKLMSEEEYLTTIEN